jgi:hypothetical protein
MPLLLLAVAIGLYFAWKKGWLPPLDWSTSLALTGVLLGLRMLETGRIVIGLALIAGSGYALFNRRRPRPGPATPPSHSQPRAEAKEMPSVVEARDILNIDAMADRETIIRAHRDMIARLHPDRGGSAILAAKVNAARDILLAQLPPSHVKTDISPH